MVSMPGFFELFIIFAALFLLFGASKLPSLGQALGEGIKNFKKGVKDDEDEVKRQDLAQSSEAKTTPLAEPTKYQNKEHSDGDNES